ncbi:MAG TPA: hypothetical protein EYP35_00155, partial [Desulfobacterales bacterium]|nr:hypothetical protein [Desulfobacterales bacterium]
SRATLARVNEKQPASLYKTVFFNLLKKPRDYSDGKLPLFTIKISIYNLNHKGMSPLLALVWLHFPKISSSDCKTQNLNNNLSNYQMSPLYVLKKLYINSEEPSVLQTD